MLALAQAFHTPAFMVKSYEYEKHLLSTKSESSLIVQLIHQFKQSIQRIPFCMQLGTSTT